MTRRSFIVTSVLLSNTSIGFSKTLGINNYKPWEVVSAVLEHFFPEVAKFEGISKINILNFIKLTTIHSTFHKRKLTAVQNGAKLLIKREPNFLKMSVKNKEKALRKYEKDRYGKWWLSTLMNLGLEAMFCDPIYGGNDNELGWKIFHHLPGTPRPTTRFGLNDV